MQRILRQADPKTTEGTYLHLTIAPLRRDLEALPIRLPALAVDVGTEDAPAARRVGLVELSESLPGPHWA